MTIIPGSAAPPEAEVQDLDYRRGNKWFPKAYGLWRVQGGALALLSWTVRLQRGWCILGADGKDGAKYCRPCGLVQCAHMTSRGSRASVRKSLGRSCPAGPSVKALPWSPARSDGGRDRHTPPGLRGG